MTSTIEVLLFYLLAWILVTGFMSLIFRGRRSEKLVLNPLIVLVKAERRFESFEKLRRFKFIGYMLDLGFIVLAGTAIWFYYTIAKRTYILLTGVRAQPIFVPIIPGITISVETFLYLLPGLSLGIILHELMHALAARYEGIRVKFIGFFVVLGILPAAFVEPEEEDLKRSRLRGKLRVYSAGVFANILLALLALGLLHTYGVTTSYIYLTKIVPGSPADHAGLRPGLLIKMVKVNDTTCRGFAEFVKYMTELSLKFGGTEKVSLKALFYLANGSVIEVFKPRGEKMIGIAFVPIPSKLVSLGLKPTTAYALYVITELALAVNLGLAVINAIPLFISDGAQALRTIISRYLGEEKAAIIVSILSTITIILILPNIYIP
jgi:membrane-associated protease RseP (regulator of RpoE activity)